MTPFFAIPHRHISWLTKFTSALSLLALMAVIITLPIMGRSHQHPETLVHYQGSSGWSPGAAWLLSISMGQYNFAAVGAVVHITDEVSDPQQTIPRILHVSFPHPLPLGQSDFLGANLFAETLPWSSPWSR